MSKMQILLFCTISLVLSLGAAVMLFPYAAMSHDRMQLVATPQPMENLPDIDLGPNFGHVPVTELVGYYIENPPVPQSGGSVARQQQFGGC